MAAESSPLEIITTVGGVHDDQMLRYRPSAIVFAPQQDLYIGNGRDRTVLPLSPDWEHLNTCGAAGEATAYRIFESPRGEIILVDEYGSTINICRVVLK